MSKKPTELTPSTKKIYERHSANLARMAKRTIGKKAITFAALGQWFINQNGLWKQSTINCYRRALVTKAAESLHNDKVLAFEELIKSGPIPHTLKSKTVSGRATKRKNITASEWKKFQAAARKNPNSWDDFIIDFLTFGLCIACRPIELGSMLLIHDTLWLQTAKANENRGLECYTPAEIMIGIINRQQTNPAGFKFRAFDLTTLDDQSRHAVTRVYDALPKLVRKKGGWAKFYDALRSRCRVLSARARVAPAISPASVRHLSISAIKSTSGVKAAAAAAGHATTKASTKNYLSGSKKSLELSQCRAELANPKAVLNVKTDPKTFHPNQRKQKIEHDIIERQELSRAEEPERSQFWLAPKKPGKKISGQPHQVTMKPEETKKIPSNTEQEEYWNRTMLLLRRKPNDLPTPIAEPQILKADVEPQSEFTLESPRRKP